MLIINTDSIIYRQLTYHICFLPNSNALEISILMEPGGFSHCPLHGSLYASHSLTQICPSPTTQTECGWWIGFYWNLTCYMSVNADCFGRLQNDRAFLPHLVDSWNWEKEREGRKQYIANVFWAYMWNEGHILTQKYIYKAFISKKQPSYWILHLWGKFTGTNMAQMDFWFHLDISQTSLCMCSLGGMGLYRGQTSRSSQGVWCSGLWPHM